MRRRQERRKRSETLISKSKQEENEGGEEEVAEEGKGFFACYLLCSLCPRFKGHTYIGFTVNPCRRIRQHNGELRSGAWRTKSKRPWEMILCIYGFPTNVTALQFEWAWQHPTESLAVRNAAASLKSLSGIVSKIKLAYTMLTLPPWQSLKLTVNYFSTKYMKEAVGCKTLPKQMRVQYSPMDELPCYTSGDQVPYERDDEDNEEEDTENGTKHRHLEEPTGLSVGRQCNGNPRGHDKPVSLMEENQPEERNSVRGEDHRLPFHLVDSPLPTSSRSTNFVDPLGLCDKSTIEIGGASRQQVGTPVAVKDHQLSSTSDFLLLSPEFSCKPFDLFPRIGESCSVQLSPVDTPVKMPTSINSGPVWTFQHKTSTGMSRENIEIEELSPKQCLAETDNNQASRGASPKIEVIDISTPSSNRITHFFPQKKRRNNWDSEKIIDLTESPKFIQL